MKPGLNKLTLIAEDFAGNKGNRVINITRSVSAESDGEILAVGENKGKNYCLLIAAQNYQDPKISSLDGPISDAIKLKLILKNDYSFSQENIISLFNPELDDFKKTLLEIRNSLNPEDNLVIFYAGHGIWSEKDKTGYWFMTDSRYTDKTTWLNNKEVLEMIAKIPARHTLLISDACFSGSVFKSRAVSSKALNYKNFENKMTRVAITSGNDSEVPDKSVFMKYLVKALKENSDSSITAQKIFVNKIMELVMSESNTEPRYGTLELAGHIGGDFIFSKK
ncbi:caspase domain-containing protein [Pedobacter aquatilis]|uniref:caspase family protein n=1 Tax=Pedobacter aquatilis TaxID=351343 RepID=UPI002930CEA6|nr:caspase family protein [Pedobacter aquatilis]